MPKVDAAKRRRIMQRSMKLGHCICDPRRPCPCDVFTEQGLCPCSGDRPDPAEPGSVRLTELVHNAGCASKISPTDLEHVLARLPEVTDPAVLSGIPAGDDAGVYRLADGTTLVQTVDVFTPCVDDPRTFGRICAANCLSDIYAMGAIPHTALSILGFPSETLDGQIMYEMMAGAMEVLGEAGCALIGGHSIKDQEIKLGFAITGTIDADAVEHGHAAVGDVLVLTKSLGVGVLNFAKQIGRADEKGLAAAEASMATLNKDAAEAMTEVGVSACTDVTGFGLFGHLISMLRHSGVTAQIYADVLPAFDGAIDALADGVIPGAVERNREYVADDIRVDDGVDEARVLLGFDAQTSGGLLIAVQEDEYEALLAALASRGVGATTVGRIVGESSGQIVVTAAGADAPAALDTEQEIDEMPNGAAKNAKPGECCAGGHGQAQPTGDDCCAGGHGQAQPTGDDCCAGGHGQAPSGDAAQAFGAMMRATAADGAIDAKTKELINLALVVLARCGPCLTHHLGAARKLGITQEQIDEAVWCAIAMGGAPVKMFYEEARQAAEGKSCC
jgi:selenide, water dikinase